jgi:hypothetical protein
MDVSLMGNIVNPDNVRVIESRCCSSFPEESLYIHTMVRTPLRWENLEGHSSPKRFMFSEVNSAHSSLSEPILNDVGAKPKALVTPCQELTGLKTGEYSLLDQDLRTAIWVRRQVGNRRQPLLK